MHLKKFFWHIFLASLALPATANATNWQLVDETISWQIGRHYVDSDSIRSEENDVVYLNKAELFDNNGNLSTYFPPSQRTVIGNCSRKEKFEIIGLDERTTRPFKSTYDGTWGRKEIDFVCNYIANAPKTQQVPSPNVAQPVSPKDSSPPTPVVVASPKERGPKSFGSGFAVAPKSVVTNNHVIASCSRIQVRQGNKFVPAAVQETSVKEDLALLYVDMGMKNYPDIRQNALLGEDVMVAGHPLAGLLATSLIVSSGQVNSLAGLGNDPTHLQISAPIQPGNSGGPLIDRAGNIVGVVISKLDVAKAAKLTGDMAQNVNFAIKPEVLRLFLDANQILYGRGRSNRRLEGTDLAQLAQSFTVQIICY